MLSTIIGCCPHLRCSASEVNRLRTPATRGSSELPLVAAMIQAHILNFSAAAGGSCVVRPVSLWLAMSWIFSEVRPEEDRPLTERLLPDELQNVNRLTTGGEDRQPQRWWKCQGDLRQRPPPPSQSEFSAAVESNRGKSNTDWRQAWSLLSRGPTTDWFYDSSYKPGGWSEACNEFIAGPKSCIFAMAVLKWAIFFAAWCQTISKALEHSQNSSLQM